MSDKGNFFLPVDCLLMIFEGKLILKIISGCQNKGVKVWGGRDICKVSKKHPESYLKRNIVTLQWRRLLDTTLSKLSKEASLIKSSNKHSVSLMRFPERETSLL